MSPKATKADTSDTDTTETTQPTDKKPGKIDLARGTFYWADPDELVIVGLDTQDGKEHPLYDPRIHRPLNDARILNFVANGVMTPVEARRNAQGKLEIVDGRGRVRYARAAKAIQVARGDDGLKVPVIIVKGNDGYLFGRSRGKNIHDGDGPMTTAQNVQRSLNYGKTVAEVAIDMGVTEQTIRNYQAMLELAPEVVDAMVKEEISSTAALQLASLPKADQVEVMTDLQNEEKATGKKTTVERAKKKVAERQGKQTKTPKDRINSAKNLLMKFAAKPAGEKTKEEMTATLERLSRVLTGQGLDKLVETDEE